MLDGNRRWVRDRTLHDPEFFSRAAREHRPTVFYLGCSDARVPANLVTRADVGELFVHRNVANQFLPAADASLAAGLRYGVHVLGIDDIVVCGHRGCGGVRAALTGGGVPSEVETWIAPLRHIAECEHTHLAHLDEDARVDALAEHNVVQQLRTLEAHPIVRSAWDAGRDLRLHGWLYDLPNGLIRPLRRIERGGRWITEVAAESPSM
jgi:carbonic anhydrase